MIALYIMYRDGVPDEDRRRLYQHARLGMAEQDAVNSLSHLGVRITRVSFRVLRVASSHQWVSTYQGPADKDTKKKLKQKPSQEEEYDLSRYKPLLRTVIEVHICLPWCCGPIYEHFLGSCEQQTRYIHLPLRQRRAIRRNSHREHGPSNPNAHFFSSERKAKLA